AFVLCRSVEKKGSRRSLLEDIPLYLEGAEADGVDFVFVYCVSIRQGFSTRWRSPVRVQGGSEATGIGYTIIKLRIQSQNRRTVYIAHAHFYTRHSLYRARSPRAQYWGGGYSNKTAKWILGKSARS